MDIAKIQQYLSYQPYFEEQPELLFENILQRLTYLKDHEKDELRDTYAFARHHHGDTKRHSGEPYIIHPIRVFEFLIDIQPDLPSLKAALLHDIIEDTEVTMEHISERFGDEVA